MKSYTSQLIEALQIQDKYIDPDSFPTHCEHDQLFLMVDPNKVSCEDKERLEQLHFSINDLGLFSSSLFGSA